MVNSLNEEYPLVSIAIITYNQIDYLRECIESCLAQDYQNFEIIVADDCSTDGTQDLLREYDTKFPGKFILRLAEKNQGITANSNSAHFACSGKYIAWMGGDDLMLPGKISLQAFYLENNTHCNIVYSDSEVFDSATNTTLAYSSQLSAQVVGGSVIDMISKGCFVGGCTAMVRASSTPPTGFDYRLARASDWKYWIDSLINGGTVDFLPNVLSRHRRHDNNVTNTNNIDFDITNYQDHLLTCQIILSENPSFRRHIRKVESSIFRSIRFYNQAKFYKHYLYLSLKCSFSSKSFFALVLSFFGKFY